MMVPPKQEDADPSESHELSEVSKATGKRRGRKSENLDKYTQAAHEKIAEFKLKLKTAKQDGVSVAQRKKWRNVISATENRLKKRYESKFLRVIMNAQDTGIDSFVNIVANRLINSGKEQLLSKILKTAQTKIESVDSRSYDI